MGRNPRNCNMDEFEMLSPKKLVDESETVIGCQLFRGRTFVEVK